MERLVRCLAGEPVFDRRTIHLISDVAFNEISESEAAVDATLAGIEMLREEWGSFTCFVIEISALKEFYLEVAEGRLYVNSFTQRDLGANSDFVERSITDGIFAPIRATDIKSETIGTQQALLAMKRIKELVGGRPIIWATHGNVVNPTKEQEHVHSVRAQLGECVKLGAEATGDLFFNPTEVIENYGTERSFQLEGKDLYHFSDVVLHDVAERYRQLIMALDARTAPHEDHLLARKEDSNLAQHSVQVSPV